MKRSLICCAAFTALLMAGYEADADTTNFAGTWVLDKSKSENLLRQFENGDSYTMIVTQDEHQLTVETKLEGGERPEGTGGMRGGRRVRGGAFGYPKTTYKLDGKETSVETQRGKSTLKASWKGSALELSSTRNLSFQGNEVTISTTERWELAEGGKSLKVDRTINTQRGTQQSTLIFNRK